MWYLNFKSLRNKIDYLRDKCNKFLLDISCIGEAKIDTFIGENKTETNIDGYQYPPLQKDHNQNDGGKIIYIKEVMKTKRLIDLEGKKFWSNFPRNYVI